MADDDSTRKCSCGGVVGKWQRRCSACRSSKCLHCGVVVVDSLSAQRRYCSLECFGHAVATQPMVACAECGVPMRAKLDGRGYPARHCSPACTRKARDCAALVRREVAALRRMARAPLQSAGVRARYERWKRQRERQGLACACMDCGRSLFAGLRGMSPSRCEDCQKKRNRVALRVCQKRRRKAGLDDRGRHRKRARRHGVRYTSVKRVFIFERDRWRCQLCGCRVRTYRGERYSGAVMRQRPADEATIDHIVPVSGGGDHVESNLQTACRACNTRKGAAPRGQLRLSV